MKTAIITGASSGLGKEYVYALSKSDPTIESFWLIARRKEKLIELASEIGSEKCFILPLDLTKNEDIDEFIQVLKDTQPEIAYLINNAGFGKLGYFKEIEASISAGQVDLNCTSLTTVTSLCLEYMYKGSQIINVASIAAFAPNTRLTVYSATKAYIYHFSKGLRKELKKEGINVLAVCPGPMETEFFSVANISPGESKTMDSLPRVNPKTMAVKSLKASKRKKAVYTNLVIYKLYRVLAKVLPHSIIMKLSQA